MTQQPCDLLKISLLPLKNPDVKAVLARLRSSSAGTTSNEQCFRSLQKSKSLSAQQSQLYNLLARHPSTRTPNGFLRFWRSFFQDMPWNESDYLDTFLRQLLKHKPQKIKQVVEIAKTAESDAWNALKKANTEENSLEQLQNIAQFIKKKSNIVKNILQNIPDKDPNREQIQTMIPKIQHYYKAATDSIARQKKLKRPRKPQEERLLQQKNSKRLLQQERRKRLQQEQFLANKLKLKNALIRFIEKMNLDRAKRTFRCSSYNAVVDDITIHYGCDGICTFSKNPYLLHLNLNNSTMIVNKDSDEIFRSENKQMDEAILGPILKSFGPSILSSLELFTLPCTRKYDSFQAKQGCLQQAFSDMNIVDNFINNEKTIKNNLEILWALIDSLNIQRGSMHLSEIINDSEYEFKIRITADRIIFFRFFENKNHPLFEYDGTTFTSHLRNLDLYRNEKGALHDRTNIDPAVLDYAIRQFQKIGILFEKRNSHSSWSRDRSEDAIPVTKARKSLSLNTLTELSKYQKKQEQIKQLMMDPSEESVETAKNWKSFI